ncbi:substrate-binding domain-containing protein [Actinomycetota bacterium]|jgi:ribose transport system substrate-binding protein|nr:substrate-binding domain-containing protein [Actinomycetota bacterium]
MKAPNSKTRKGATAFAAAIALSLTAAACSSDDSASDCDIGMVQINQTAAFFTQMNEGAEEAAAAAGCELTIANANGDPAKQNSDIENFVTQGVTGLIVVAIDVNGVLPAVQDAMADGIKVVAIDAKLDEGNYDTFVGVDNEAAGAEIGQWVVDEGLADGTSYGVIGAKNSFIQNQREDSFKAVVDANGMVFTQSVSGDNVQEQAADAAVNLVTAQPDLDYIYTTGEPATVGAVSALDAASATKIIGWDLTREVISGLDSGSVIAIVQQDPRTEGVEAVNEIKSLLDGGTAAGFIDVPIAIVTPDDVEPYRVVFP